MCGFRRLTLPTRRSARQLLDGQQCGLVNARMGEHLHTICTCSASLLHPRELACCDKGQGWPGCDLVRLRQAGAFLLWSKPYATRHFE